MQLQDTSRHTALCKSFWILQSRTTWGQKLCNEWQSGWLAVRLGTEKQKTNQNREMYYCAKLLSCRILSCAQCPKVPLFEWGSWICCPSVYVENSDWFRDANLCPVQRSSFVLATHVCWWSVWFLADEPVCIFINLILFNLINLGVGERLFGCCFDLHFCHLRNLS